MSAAEKASPIQLYTTPMHIFGAVIYAHRHRLGMTQGEFKRALNHSHQATISRMERGEINATVTTIIDYAKVIGLPASALIGSVEQYTTCLLRSGVNVLRSTNDAQGMMLMSFDQLCSLLSSYGGVTVVSNQKDAI